MSPCVDRHYRGDMNAWRLGLLLFWEGGVRQVSVTSIKEFYENAICVKLDDSCRHVSDGIG